MKKILSLSLLFGIFWLLGCKKENNKVDKSGSSSVGEIVEVFELRFLDTKTITVDNQMFKFAIKDIIDSVIVDCSLVDFVNNIEGPKSVRVHTYLQVNEMPSLLKVSSKPCGTISYKNDNTDIQDVTDRINQFKTASQNLNDKNEYYNQEFNNLFGSGSVIEGTSLKIFLAKAFPLKYNNPGAVSSDYKFIFIVTNNKGL